ncbi:hypothetical protein [Pelagibacterium montanilacus]|uniref:hypothetical protein n=1 Tax=Pelagibacterium montanilacus TaxID=2185280 RepID=UPI000F8E0452|nr:hypothetical protein [Pelagibacterium montanilacus]
MSRPGLKGQDGFWRWLKGRAKLGASANDVRPRADLAQIRKEGGETMEPARSRDYEAGRHAAEPPVTVDLASEIVAHLPDDTPPALVGQVLLEAVPGVTHLWYGPRFRRDFRETGRMAPLAALAVLMVRHIDSETFNPYTLRDHGQLIFTQASPAILGWFAGQLEARVARLGNWIDMTGPTDHVAMAGERLARMAPDCAGPVVALGQTMREAHKALAAQRVEAVIAECEARAGLDWDGMAVGGRLAEVWQPAYPELCAQIMDLFARHGVNADGAPTGERLWRMARIDFDDYRAHLGWPPHAGKVADRLCAEIGGDDVDIVDFAAGSASSILEFNYYPGDEAFRQCLAEACARALEIHKPPPAGLVRLDDILAGRQPDDD